MSLIRQTVQCTRNNEAPAPTLVQARTSSQNQYDPGSSDILVHSSVQRFCCISRMTCCCWLHWLVRSVNCSRRVLSPVVQAHARSWIQLHLLQVEFEDLHELHELLLYLGCSESLRLQHSLCNQQP